MLCLCVERDEHLIDIESAESQQHNVASILRLHFPFCFQVSCCLLITFEAWINFHPFVGRANRWVFLPEMLGKSVRFSWVLHPHWIRASVERVHIRGKHHWWHKVKRGIRWRHILPERGTTSGWKNRTGFGDSKNRISAPTDYRSKTRRADGRFDESERWRVRTAFQCEPLTVNNENQCYLIISSLDLVSTDDDSDDGVDNFDSYFTPPTPSPTTAKPKKGKTKPSKSKTKRVKKERPEGYVKRKWTRREPKSESKTFQ